MKGSGVNMIGILCEKPSAGRNFAAALGGAKGTFNGEDYVIACARGHLYEFDVPEKQVAPALAPKYKSWSIDNLPWNEDDFKWIYVKKKDAVSTLADIKKTLSPCDEIVIATDNDPTGEGELLAWEILDALNFAPHKWSRMYFEDESPKEIQKAFKTRKTIQSMLSDKDYIKAFYRARWDFLSMQWTRIATICGDGRSVLRNGRLKSAMILLVGDQLKAIAAYKKIPSYQNRFKDENSVVYTNPEEPTYPNKNDVPNTYHDSEVVVDEKKMKATPPPKLLDLAGLASRLSSKFSSKMVSDVYQKMYEAHIVSYPRTEDKMVSPEQFNELLPLVDKIAAVVGIDPKLLTHRTQRKTHIKTGQAHGANRPGTTVPGSLSELDTKFGPCASAIYSLLAHNYLAILAEDYEYEFQKGHLKDYPDFKGTANVPKSLGWKAIYTDEDIADDESAGLGKLAKPFIYEGFPPKPATPTMSWLMKQLEKYDVGTGATRVNTYSEVTNAKAKFPILKDTKGKITMTQYGDMSYYLLPGTNIGSLKITERLYSEMRDVAEGKKDPEACLHDIQSMISEDIKIMKQNGIAMRKELKIMANGNDVERYEGTWNGQSVKFKRTWSGHRFTDDECEALCNGDEIEIEAVSSKTGKPFKCKGKLAEQEFNGRTYIGFMNTGFAPRGIPDEWCKHKFTDDEKTLLETGMTVLCEDCVSSKNKAFKAKVRWTRRDNGQMGIEAEFV